MDSKAKADAVRFFSMSNEKIRLAFSIQNETVRKVARRLLHESGKRCIQARFEVNQ
jgi:hypothetical protein